MGEKRKCVDVGDSHTRSCFEELLGLKVTETRRRKKSLEGPRPKRIGLPDRFKFRSESETSASCLEFLDALAACFPRYRPRPQYQFQTTYER